jgi:hypothetical protein
MAILLVLDPEQHFMYFGSLWFHLELHCKFPVGCCWSVVVLTWSCGHLDAFRCGIDVSALDSFCYLWFFDWLIDLMDFILNATFL